MLVVITVAQERKRKKTKPNRIVERERGQRRGRKKKRDKASILTEHLYNRVRGVALNIEEKKESLKKTKTQEVSVSRASKKKNEHLQQQREEEEEEGKDEGAKILYTFAQRKSRCLVCVVTRIGRGERWR